MKKVLLVFSLIIIQGFFLWGCKKSDSSTEPEQKQTSSQADLSGIIYEKVLDGIHKFDANTQEDKKLFDGTYPERLSNGTIIYILDYPNRLVISNENGSSQRTIVENRNLIFQCPQISPDGNMVALQNISSSSLNSISEGTLVYKLDGSLVKSFNNLFHPSWTPDGKLVLSGSYYNLYGPQTVLQEGIFITDSNLDNPKRIDPNLTKPMMPSVSPDGKQVAFVLDKHIWIMNIGGTGLRQLTKSTSYEGYPAWTQNGKYIFFNYYRGASVMAAVPIESLTTITDETECFVFTKDSHLLNSSTQIVFY